MAEIRRDILEECWDDSKLSQIAYFCERHGRQVWMKAAVDALVVDPLLWRRATGLALASFACITRDEFDRIVERARIRSTRVEDRISDLIGNVRNNLFAQYWYRLFFRSTDPDAWWSAFSGRAPLRRRAVPDVALADRGRRWRCRSHHQVGILGRKQR